MISRGQVYFVDPDPTRRREQAGRCPVLVVSSDSINRQPLVVTVVVGTDSANVRHDYTTNVPVTSGEPGLPKDTVFLCFQIRSLDPARFMDARTGLPALAGSLPRARMAEVETAIRWALSLS